MKGIEAFQELLPLLKDEPVVHANGFICRESFSLKDREANFRVLKLNIPFPLFPEASG